MEGEEEGVYVKGSVGPDALTMKGFTEINRRVIYFFSPHVPGRFRIRLCVFFCNEKEKKNTQQQEAIGLGCSGRGAM